MIISSEKQVVSKKRVADHGEVFTHSREVNAMLDLVKEETERIESTFLEPACGTGNFLVEILSRKLDVVSARYSKSQLEYERNAILAVGSIYGIDILADNVAACQKRLFNIFNQQYTALYKAKCKDAFRNSVSYILSCNILHGDALSLKTVGDETNPPQPIVFSQWKIPFNDSRIKRHDYLFQAIFADEKNSNPDDLFSVKTSKNRPKLKDNGETSFIPEPIKAYPLTHFLELANESRSSNG